MDNKIKNYICEKILRGQIEIDNQTSLYQSGLISSLSHMKLMNFLERTYGVNITSTVINMDDFDNVTKIEMFINNLMEER